MDTVGQDFEIAGIFVSFKGQADIELEALFQREIGGHDVRAKRQRIQQAQPLFPGGQPFKLHADAPEDLGQPRTDRRNVGRQTIGAMPGDAQIERKREPDQRYGLRRILHLIRQGRHVHPHAQAMAEGSQIQRRHSMFICGPRLYLGSSLTPISASSTARAA